MAVTMSESFTVHSARAPAPPHPSSPDGWDPHTYPAFTAAMGPLYEELHDAVLDATRDRNITCMLELGIGTGVEASRLLSVHAGASVVGVDANQAMLDAAALALPPEQTTLTRSRLEDPLPPGPFDLVVSVLAVHHLDSLGKADLFARIADVLAPGGRFVLGDPVRDSGSPRDESPAQRLRRSLRETGLVGTTHKLIRRVGRAVSSGHVGHDHDHPDRPADQIAWLIQAGLRAEVALGPQALRRPHRRQARHGVETPAGTPPPAEKYGY